MAGLRPAGKLGGITRRRGGRMPPRMGAWQPGRLRYGAATKCPARIVAAREETNAKVFEDELNRRPRVAERPRGAEEECPHEWGHSSLEGYATVLRRSAPQESSRRAKKQMPRCSKAS